MAKSKAEKPKKPAAKPATSNQDPDPAAQAKSEEDAAAREAEDARLKLLDQDEEEEQEQELLDRALKADTTQPTPGTLDKSICVIEYIGPKRRPFPVMFGDDITWFGRNIYDGLEPWQGRVERWYADAIMAKEPGWWKVIKKSPPPPKKSAAPRTEFETTAWMSVRTLEDVELFAKRIDRATPPARISYLRKLITSFRMVQTKETAAAIDDYVEMFPPVVASPEDAPRGGTRRVEDDQDATTEDQDELANGVAPPAETSEDDDAAADEAEFQ